MNVIAIYVIATTAAYYLAVRAKITQWVWSKYPTWLDNYLMCAACSGFAYGTVVGVVGGWHFGWAFLGLRGATWYTPIAVGLGSMIWTPIAANLHISALVELGVVDSRQAERTDS